MSIMAETRTDVLFGHDTGLGRGADGAADGGGAGTGGGGDTTDVPLSAIGEVGMKANHPPLGTKTGSNRRDR
jgi:hypothetical protein